MRWTSLIVGLISALSACGGSGGPAFTPTFPDNVDADVATVLSRLQSQPPPADEYPVAAGLTTGELFVVNLQSRQLLWKQAVQSPVSAPQIAGDLVALHEQSGVVVRDLYTGDIRFTLEDDALHLAGADGEGELAAICLTTGGGVGARSKLVVARGGSIAWTKTIDHAAGAPAVAAGMVFVPWATQNLTVLDAASGDEIARVRISDSTVGHALRHHRDIYFGQRGLFRLTPSVTAGSAAETAHFEPMTREIPGDPAFMIDPYRPAPAPSSALHRVRYAWHPAGQGDEVRLTDDNLYAVFYRIVFALDPANDAVRWVYQHEHDIVGALAQEGGLLVADANGGFARIDAADGRRHWSHGEDVAPLAVTLRAEAFGPSDAAEGDVSSLHDQLLSAAQNTDARLVPARVLAVHMLRTMPEGDVTGHLVALCDDRRAPPTVKAEACSALAGRTTGPEHVMSALERHARFLEQTTAPPVGALAQAAVTMRATSAVPLLLSHLRDPETAEADLVPLIEALETLEDRSAVEPLADFLRLYHAEASTDGLVAAVGAAADALIALQGPAAEDVIREAAEDGLAPAAVRTRLTQALAALQEPAEEEPSEEGEGTEEETTEEEPDDRPDRIDARVVEQVLQPVQTEMRACVRGDSQNARNARIVLRLAGDGALEGLSIAPARLQSCIEPLVRRVRFPANRQNVREQVTYTVRR